MSTEASTATQSSTTETQSSTAGNEVQNAALDGKQPVAKRDYNVEMSNLLKESGFKMKFRGAERAVTFEELVQKAHRGQGADAMLEDHRIAKSQADELNRWKAALEADDTESATTAFDRLSPKAQANAMAWLQRKAQAYEQEQKLPPEAQQERKQRQELEQKLKQYEQADQQRKAAEQKQAELQELRGAQQTVLGIVQKTLTGIGANEAVAPALVPLAARHLRVALEVAQASGGHITPEQVHAEVIENVRQDLVEQFSMLTSGFKDDSALFNWLGPKVVARLARESIRRRNNGGQQGASAVSPTARPAPKRTEEQPRAKTAVEARALNRKMFG